MKNFREIVRESLRAVIDAATPLVVGDPLADKVALDLKDRLNAEGYAIHEIRLCVRPGDASQVGRPLTEEERRFARPLQSRG